MTAQGTSIVSQLRTALKRDKRTSIRGIPIADYRAMIAGRNPPFGSVLIVADALGMRVGARRGTRRKP